MGGRAEISLPEHQSRVCIVLVEPMHDGNIGAVARSIMNFGITDLRVVGRNGIWSEETRKRAKNAQVVLENAQVSDSLEEAVSDCSVVIGTSGKREDGDKTVMRHFLLPDELPNRLTDVDGKVALVFGPEGKGLLNEAIPGQYRSPKALPTHSTQDPPSAAVLHHKMQRQNWSYQNQHPHLS